MVCNGAGISINPVLTTVKSNQECHAAAPYSQINASVGNVGGSVGFSSSAIGNSSQIIHHGTN